MRFGLILLSFLSITAFSLNAQIQWERLFSNKSEDVFRSVQEVSPGNGFVAAGYISDSTDNDSDAVVVRYNTNGDTLWTYSYNGLLSNEDLFYKIIVTSDGGFLAGGYTFSATGISDDLLYIKLDASGQMEWVKTFGGSGRERIQDIVETPDGYTIAGYTNSLPAQYYDALLLKIDFGGNTIWSKIIGESGYDDANAIELLPDGGYILGGQSNNGSNGLDQFLIRTDSSGDTLWTKRFGSTLSENIESIVLLNDGYLFCGHTNTPTAGDDGYLVRTDTSGNILWTKTYGGNLQDDFHRVEKTSDGGYILSGTSTIVNPDMWLVKTDSLGNTEFDTSFGGDNNHDHGYSAVQTSDGGYILAGYTGSYGFNNREAYIIKLGSNPAGPGQLTYIAAFTMASQICSNPALKIKVRIRNFGNKPISNIPVTVELTGAVTQTLNGMYTGPLNPNDIDTVSFTPTINTTGGGVVNVLAYTGITNSVIPQRNLFTHSETIQPCVGIEKITALPGIELFPSPAQENLYIEFTENYRNVEIEFINFTGAVLGRYNLGAAHSVRESFDVSGLARGLYVVKLKTEKGIDSRMIILE